MKKRYLIISLITVFILTVIGVVYFGGGKDTSDTSLEDENVITISQGTVGSFGDLRIGVAYVRRSEYVDSYGVKRHGLIAGLWILVGDDGSKEEKLDVYTGQSFQINKYVLYVAEIKRVLWRGSVSLHIQEAAKP